MGKKKSFVTVTDQFCGAGGSSLGAEATGLEVSLALNHWKLAIETHNTNFPDTLHDCADISATDPRRYPSTDILITSPECTNHSIAKGAKKRRRQMSLFDKQKIDPSAKRSRATMWDVPRFAEYHDYNLIIVENVIDARDWIMWDAWILAMDKLGYAHHVIYFNSMFAHLEPSAVKELHHFAPQSRDRMYVTFWKKGNKRPNLDFRPKAYCDGCGRDVEAVQVWKQTRKVRQMGGRWGRYKDQYFYACPHCSGKEAREVTPYFFAAANAIDWSLPATRIGDRQRPLKPKTLARIKKGLEKFGHQCLILELAHSHGTNNRSRPITGVQFTQTIRQSQALLMTSAYLVILRRHHGAKSINGPLDTIVAGGNHHGLVTPAFMTSYYGSNGNQRALDEPMGTITTNDRHGLVQMPFLLGYANGSGPSKDVVDSLRTIHTANGQGLALPDGIRVEDCRFRMLQPHEIGRGMAFPEDYAVLGTKRDQVKQYGNAVTPPVMKMILKRCLETFS